MIAQLKALTCQQFGHKIASMTEAEHEKKLQKIRNETEEIKRQIMQMEFQHKKDIVESDRRLTGEWLRSNLHRAKTTGRSHFWAKRIDHLVKLVGFSYDELDQIDATLTETGMFFRVQENVPGSNKTSWPALPAFAFAFLWFSTFLKS